ncbi:MAG: recombination regulator RecX [Burkholderiales bacterium]|nr:recombination regulator RecX [Burkholderiales bacterium]
MASSDHGNDTRDGASPDAGKALRNKALRLLTTREHSREELLRKLGQARARRARQNADSAATQRDDVERIVDELAAAGWQSDERYAEALVRRLGDQASRRFIEDRLAQSGIAKEVAQHALTALERDERDLAGTLRQRRFGDEPPADERARERQIRFLLSRGFHLGDAFKVVPRAVARRDEDQTADADARVAPARDGGDGTSTLRRGTPLRRSRIPRARPWGARNDADPPDEA